MSHILYVCASRKIDRDYTWFVHYILEMWIYKYGICNEIVCCDYKHISSMIISFAKKHNINTRVVNKINIINTDHLIIFNHKKTNKYTNKNTLWTAIIMDN